MAPINSRRMMIRGKNKEEDSNFIFPPNKREEKKIGGHMIKRLKAWWSVGTATWRVARIAM